MVGQVTLSNGRTMPQLGLGVFRMEDPGLCRDSILAAIEAGYRHIDTAAFYQNERAVGEAVRQCGLPREALFVTSKLWKDAAAGGVPAQAFLESIERLDIGYLNLFLVHWPVHGKVAETWSRMEEIYATGAVKSIGVSNHRICDLDEIRAMKGMVPVVNQVECQPYFQQRELVAYCDKHNIKVQAWSPLAAQKVPLLEEPALREIGLAHGKTPAQVVLRWNIQRGITPLPKSQNPVRQKENLDVFDFALSEGEMVRIAAMDCGKRTGPDPDEFGKI